MARILGQGPEVILAGRLQIAAVLMILVFGLFAGRLFQLQIVEGESLRLRSEQNMVRTMRLEAPRGRILDREGRVLATTRPAFGLQVTPNDLRDDEVTLAALGRLVSEEPAVLAERIGPRRGARRVQPVRLVDDLSFERLAKIEAHRHAIPGVGTAVLPRRHYLEGEFAAHAMGTIGEIRADQLEMESFEGYRSGEVVGQTGLEARLERHLRGSAGGRNVVVDVAGREVEVLDEVPPVSGGSVVLALDLDLQRAAEDAFREVEEGQSEKMGAVVALDVRNGDVLVMASRPAYDPNYFAGGIDSETWKALTEHEWDPLQNRAIQNHYPPGSTYKAVVAAALLDAGTITPSTTVYCPGFFRHGRRTYRCWKRGGHGDVNVHQALRSSCDVFFYTFGVKLGIDGIAEIAKGLGLGARTGVELPQEATGLVPTRKWKERRFGEPWYPGETVSASIGQGFNLTTPIQLAVAYAAIANGGAVLKPRLVLRTETKEGEPIEEFAPEVRSRLELAPEHLAVVLGGLEAVVNEKGGTGGRARVPGVRVGGKTGTTQVVRLEHTEGMEEDEIPMRYRDHAWFAAFAPVEDPQIAVAVFVEHGQHGSSAAAPIAQRILARYFEKQGVVPPPGDAQVAATGERP